MIGYTQYIKSTVTSKRGLTGFVTTETPRAIFFGKKNGTRLAFLPLLFRIILHKGRIQMASFGWDQGQIYSTSVLPGEEQVNSHSEITALFLEFIQNFRVSNNYIYRYITHIYLTNT